MKYDKTDIPSRYVQARKLPKETIALWLSTITKYVPQNAIATIIDVGCGTGRFTKELADHFSAQVYGIDPSSKMLKEAIENVISTKVKFLQGSTEHISLNDDFSDLVFLSQVYHHIEDKNRAFLEIKRVLKTGKFLCIRTSTIENLNTILYLRFFPQALKKDMEFLSSRNDVIDTVHSSGFKLKGHEIVRQKFANNLKEYTEKIKSRGLSDLVSITDGEFHDGLAKLEIYCKEQDTETDVIEELDFFIYTKV
ncbi:MAG: class I SAM-dependent methyltransferase [bacterium]